MSAPGGAAVQLEAAVRRRGEFTLGPLSLSLAAGAWTALRGPSGAGKSTLLQLVAGLDRLDEGRLTLFGEDVTHASEGRLAALRRARIGLVLQERRFVEHLLAWENVALRLVPLGVPARERRDRAAAELEHLDVLHALDRRPSTLSGGEQQRLAVARALVGAPGLLLADEPTASVDGATAERILKRFTRLRAEGVTLLVSAHDERLLAPAEAVLTLEQGRLGP